MRSHIATGLAYIGQCPLCGICELHATCGQFRQVRQRGVLFAVHEQARAGQCQKLRHQVVVVREIDHRLEDSAYRTGTYLVAQVHREQGARGGVRTAGPFDEVVEEAIVVGGMREDLPAQEAVFGGEVAFDVGEAQDTVWFLVRQHQRGQAAHRMPDQVETPDVCVVQESLRVLDQERDRDAR